MRDAVACAHDSLLNAQTHTTSEADKVGRMRSLQLQNSNCTLRRLSTKFTRLFHGMKSLLSSKFRDAVAYELRLPASMIEGYSCIFAQEI